MINFPIDLLKLIDIFLDIFKRKRKICKLQLWYSRDQFNHHFFARQNYHHKNVGEMPPSLVYFSTTTQEREGQLTLQRFVLIIHFETFTTNIPLTETLLSFELLYHGK